MSTKKVQARFTHLANDSILRKHVNLVNDNNLLNSLQRLEEITRLIRSWFSKKQSNENDYQQKCKQCWSSFLHLIECSDTLIKMQSLFQMICAVSPNADTNTDKKKPTAVVDVMEVSRQWTEITCFLAKQNQPTQASVPNQTNQKMVDPFVLACSMNFYLIQLELIMTKHVKTLMELAASSMILTPTQERIYNEDLKNITTTSKNYTSNIGMDTKSYLSKLKM